MSKRVRQKPPPQTEPKPELKVEWYSRDSGAECFAIRDEQGNLRAQIKIHGHIGLATTIIAALKDLP